MNIKKGKLLLSKTQTWNIILSWLQTFAMFWMLFAFFWVIPRHLKFVCQRFGTLCLLHLHTFPPMKMEQKECSETLAYKTQTPGNYPEESIQHTIICLVVVEEHLFLAIFINFLTCRQLPSTSRGQLSTRYLKIRYAVVTRAHLIRAHIIPVFWRN
jgi:hypothetical protein